jgi:hypothetical protein
VIGSAYDDQAEGDYEALATAANSGAIAANIGILLEMLVV